MKKLFSALILCAAILCSCSEKGGEKNSETDVPETSSAAVATESSAETVTEAETTTTIATTTATEETTVRKSAERKIILTPIPSNEPFEVMGCKIIEDMAIDNEEDFPDKEVIKRAREICFADGEIYKIITEENNRFTEEEYGENADIYKIETAEDIPFICGLEYDFDGDGVYEYVISLQYYATPIGMDGSFVIYIDGDKYEILLDGGNPVFDDDMRIISSRNNDYCFLILNHTSGYASYYSDIYGFESGIPEKAFYYDGANYITFKNGVFYNEIKYGSAYPFILCEDGKFRQLGREKISREDFEARVKNGGEYLDSLAKSGETITEIYTYGHYSYELCGEDFCYMLNNVFWDNRLNYVPEEMRFTDEVIYGGDVWAVKPVRNND